MNKQNKWILDLAEVSVLGKHERFVTLGGLMKTGFIVEHVQKRIGNAMTTINEGLKHIFKAC